MDKEFNSTVENKVVIVFYSFTGQTRRFVEKVKAVSTVECIELKDDLKVDSRFILLTSTIGFGQVPEPVATFLENNHKNMVAVMSNGNKNWGQNFAKAGDIISEHYKVPLIARYELAGTNEDVQTLIEYMRYAYGE